MDQAGRPLAPKSLVFWWTQHLKLIVTRGPADLLVDTGQGLKGSVIFYQEGGGALENFSSFVNF